jgi:hypothetical protein
MCKNALQLKTLLGLISSSSKTEVSKSAIMENQHDPLLSPKEERTISNL